MTVTYTFLKALLDPIIPVLLFIGLAFFVSFKMTRKKSVWLLFLLPFFMLYGVSISPVSNKLCYFLEKNYFLNTMDNVSKLDIVVILGGGISENKYLKETMPSQRTASRIIHAVQVFRKSGANYLVCVGKGVGKLSEADIMGRAVERLGVPRDKIKLDSDSRNTREHAIELNKMFRNKNIRIGLVTSAYHMKRSEREFRRYFQNVTPLPSDYLYSTSTAPLVFSFIPNSGSFHKTSMAFHEIIGLIWYRVKNT